MMPPLVVVDTHGEVSVYQSAETLCDRLEAPDVRDDEFRVFDSAGVEYQLHADSDAAPVVVGPPVTGTADFETVLAIGRAYLARLPSRVRIRLPIDDVNTPEDLQRALPPIAG